MSITSPSICLEHYGGSRKITAPAPAKIILCDIGQRQQVSIGDGNTANDDQFWLSYSKDGGHTYSTEIVKSAGEGGQWDLRVIWRRLGQARNWIFKIRTWTTARPVFKGLIAKMYGEESKR